MPLWCLQNLGPLYNYYICLLPHNLVLSYITYRVSHKKFTLFKRYPCQYWPLGFIDSCMSMKALGVFWKIRAKIYVKEIFRKKIILFRAMIWFTGQNEIIYDWQIVSGSIYTKKMDISHSALSLKSLRNVIYKNYPITSSYCAK
jgi:hypothetical protein